MARNVYVFTATQSGIPAVRVLRGLAPPKLISGSAKWEVVDRPKRKGATQYLGLDPRRMAIPVLFDGWRDRHSVEPGISNLEKMRHEVDGIPPVVRINTSIPGGVPVSGIGWVIESIEYGDTVIWDFDHNKKLVRFRQDATVQLLEFVSAETVAIDSRPPGNTRGTKTSGPKHGIHVVVAGETLPQIAVKQYKGDRNKWKAIAAANGIRDYRKIKVGQVLALP